MMRPAGLLLALGIQVGAWGLHATDLGAQRFRDIPPALLLQVQPAAERFAERAGSPPVFRAYATGGDGQEELIGFVFHTADLPPERTGYSGPIEALVGMDLDGRLTGVRITDYWESLRSSRGDFMRTPGVQEQYVGKHLGDAFSVGSDLDGVSRATISARALALGVRDAARRVADAYLEQGRARADEPTERFEALDWLELRRRGLIEPLLLRGVGGAAAEVSLAFLENDPFGEILVGERAMEMVQRARSTAPGAHIVLYGVDGSDVRLFQRAGWRLVQESDTVPLPTEDVRPFGLAAGGVMDAQMTSSGLMVLDAALNVDRPFTLVYAPDADLGPFAVEVRTQAARLAAESASTAPSPALAPPSPDAAAAEVPLPESPAPETRAPPTRPADLSPTEEGEERPAALRDAPTDGTALTGPAAATEARDTFVPELTLSQDETFWERAVAQASGRRVAGMLLTLALALAAFLTETRSLRAISLGVTLLYLGFLDGGFLSVSHITSAIWVGPGVFLDNLPLLLIVLFTLVTTVVWGRVFCGFLCPFGALQDLIARIRPRRGRRTLPEPVHRRALWIKYGVLALIVGSALTGSHTSLYPYFEPFGTVFFGSQSAFLITIALAILALCAVVPRFYCRYVCPLGAALAVGSLLTVRRVPRVEQCTHCRVCEQRCPTGAIAGPVLDFKECVRCNVCEVSLREKAGVCRHDMTEIRPRLVRIERSRSASRVHAS